MITKPKNLRKGIDFDYEVSRDGGRVWVTGPDGSSIGRFNKVSGIDIHTTFTEQMAGASECLYCTHQTTTEEDWITFCEKIKTHYNIHIPKNLIKF